MSFGLKIPTTKRGKMLHVMPLNLLALLTAFTLLSVGRSKLHHPNALAAKQFIFKSGRLQNVVSNAAEGLQRADQEVDELHSSILTVERTVISALLDYDSQAMMHASSFVC